MKKLGLTLIAAAGMFFITEGATAQVEQETQNDQTTQQNQEQQTQDQQTQEQEAQEQQTQGQQTQSQQKQDRDFEEVDVVALPQDVKDAVMTDYSGAVTEEAWVKEKDGKTVYKLSLNADGEKQKVFADAEGNWIDKDEIKGKKKGKDKDRGTESDF